MLKVVMKEPVTSGVTPKGDMYARGLNWVSCLGEITPEFKETLSKALQENTAISMMESNGQPILIPARNIAWIQVLADEGSQTP